MLRDNVKESPRPIDYAIFLTITHSLSVISDLVQRLCNAVDLFGHAVVFSGLFCFKRKSPDQCKTSFRTLNSMLLLHDDLKKNPHVCLCCF